MIITKEKIEAEVEVDVVAEVEALKEIVLEVETKKITEGKEVKKKDLREDPLNQKIEIENVKKNRGMRVIKLF
jgi:hypothetical protein